MKNIEWFKVKIAPRLNGYEIKYKFFEEGDFGALNLIEFNSQEMGGEIDFWSTGWLGIHLVDYIGEVELLNILIEPLQNERKEESLKRLLELLSIEVEKWD